MKVRYPTGRPSFSPFRKINIGPIDIITVRPGKTEECREGAGGRGHWILH